jgi:hypothetical protein
LRRVRLQIGELKFELIQQPCATLRGSSELLVLELLDRELELLDQQPPRLRFALRCQPGRTLRAQHRLQHIDIVGKRIVDAHRTNRIISRRFCPD